MKTLSLDRMKAMIVVSLWSLSCMGYAQSTIVNYNSSGTLVSGAGVTTVMDGKLITHGRLAQSNNSIDKEFTKFKTNIL